MSNPPTSSSEEAPRGVPGALPTADLAPTGRAKCIGCETAIPAKSIRIAVERQIDTGRFVTTGAGYLHPACVQAWAAREEKDLAELVAKVVAHSALAELPTPFGTAPAAPAPAPVVAKPDPAAAKPAPEPVQDLPPFEGMKEKKIRDIAQKIDKLFDPNGYKQDAVLEKADVPWNRRKALYWYLTAHRLIAAENNSGVLNRLVESLDEAPNGVVIPLLGRLTASIKDLFRDYGQGTLLFPRWVNLFDSLALHALRTEPDALGAAMDTLPPDIRLGVAFVRGRSGLPIADADRKAIFKQIVHVALTKDANVYLHIYVVKGDKLEKLFELSGHALLPNLAALFIDGEEAWAKAIEAGLARGTWTGVAQVAAGLRRVPLDKFIAMVGKRDYLDRDPGSLFAILDARKDAIADVLQSALQLPSDYEGGSRRVLRELLLVWGLSRLAARGETVPIEIANALLLDEFADSLRDPFHRALRDGYLAVMRALPKDAALALARRQLATEYSYNEGLPILAAHFDDGLLREFLPRAATGYLNLDALLLIGSAALPALVDTYKGTTDAKLRTAMLVPIVAILGASSEALSPIEDAAVSALGADIVDCGDGEQYFSSERRDATERLLKRLPAAKRRELVLAKLQQATYADRAYRFVALDDDRGYRVASSRIMASRSDKLTDEGNFETAVRSFGADAAKIFAEALGAEQGTSNFLRKLESALGSKGFAEFGASRGLKPKNWLENMRDMCAEAEGPRETIYVLEPPYQVEECGLAPRAGSWSRLGGAGPSGIDVPKRKDGEPLEHVLTIDLQEAPELAKRFSGARAVSLFVPDKSSGEDYEDSEVVAIPESAKAPKDGDPLFVLPLDVPSAIFDRKAANANPLLEALRKALFNRSGWALGEPMWIQDDEGGFDLLMQLSEGMGLNCGDSGCLYVFEDAILMQCY